MPGEGLWDVLSVDYTKCLTSLLHYAPHSEHLGDAEWEKLIEFCLAVINTQEGDESQLGIRSGNRSAPEDLLDANDSRSTPVRLTTPGPANRARSASNINAIGEVVECIQLLTVSPSAPVQAAAETILQALVEFVITCPAIAGNTQQLAFSSINAVALKVLFDQSDLVRSSTLGLIPVVRRLWPTKVMKLKDELLITLMVWMVVLFDGVHEDPPERVTRTIEDLIDTLHSEYLKRPEKDLLQIDDITLNSTPMESNRPVYGPRLGSSRSEHNWTVIWSIANLSKLSGNPQVHSPDSDVADDKSSKRRRFNSSVDDIFRDAVSATGTRRVCALQLVPFLVNERSIEQKEDLIQRLVPNILDDNSAISSWTMVALARSVYQYSRFYFCLTDFKNSLVNGPDAQLPVLKGLWVRVMDLSSRVISSFPTSRAACNLMGLILEADLLENSVVTDYIRSMLMSANLNGPSSISDASLSLWVSIARRKTQLNLASVQSASKQICSWLREIWTIGKIHSSLLR